MTRYKREHKNDMNWPQVLDHPYRILIIRGPGSCSTSKPLNLIKQQDNDDHGNIYKIYLLQIKMKQNNILL